jgi:hypothetical protein
MMHFDHADRATGQPDDGHSSKRIERFSYAFTGAFATVHACFIAAVAFVLGAGGSVFGLTSVDWLAGVLAAVIVWLVIAGSMLLPADRTRQIPEYRWRIGLAVSGALAAFFYLADGDLGVVGVALVSLSLAFALTQATLAVSAT